MKLGLSIIISILFTAGVFAQKGNVTAEIFPDNSPTADKLPLPDYPKIASNAGLDGRVSVEVVLDEKGNVKSADDADGPYPVCKLVADPKVLALRNSALHAAKKARFSSTAAQNTSGMRFRIAYNFLGEHALKLGRYNVRLDDGNAKTEKTTALGIKVTETGNSDTSSGINPNPELGDGKGVGDSQKPKTVSGGVLNKTAMTLTKPSYPAAARAIRAGGMVVVQVLILEEGNMYSAKAISGHPLLRRASEIAACSSKFTPTLLSGEPVKVSGVITYNYAP
ncbi:MAG: energy transducer TonB [Pyrinomonadaceae bacterium]